METPRSSRGLGTLGSGAVTALALAIQNGLAAIVGIVAGHEFGRSPTTDGFNATYGVFIVVSFAAAAIRVAVMPALARAREENRLGSEAVAYGMTMTCLSLPLLLLALTAASPVAWLLTGAGPAAARHAAADALPWMIAAAVLQLFAGLAASSLAALDNYAIAAAGYALGSAVGLAYILLRMHPDGIIALPRGMALSGAVALLVPLLALLQRALAERMPAEAVRPSQFSFRARTKEIANCVSLPLAMQFIYLICLTLAARRGVGAQTSFNYAYLIAAAVVTVTGASLSLVTSVPLTRIGLDSARTTRRRRAHRASASRWRLQRSGRLAARASGRRPVALGNHFRRVLGDFPAHVRRRKKPAALVAGACGPGGPRTARAGGGGARRARGTCDRTCSDDRRGRRTDASRASGAGRNGPRARYRGGQHRSSGRRRLRPARARSWARLGGRRRLRPLRGSADRSPAERIERGLEISPATCLIAFSL
ncbi:MAG: hypothetical protein ABSC36_03195 [Gaiellaceae bacterium]